MMERYSNTDFLQLLSLTCVALILNDLSLLAEVDAKAVMWRGKKWSRNPNVHNVIFFTSYDDFQTLGTWPTWPLFWAFFGFNDVTKAMSPLIFILSPGADPGSNLYRFAAEMLSISDRIVVLVAWKNGPRWVQQAWGRIYPWHLERHCGMKIEQSSQIQLLTYI